MQNFKKLECYLISRQLTIAIYKWCKNQNIEYSIENQLKRAVLSISLNIAEGNGRSSDADKRHFYVIARGSTLECSAIFDIISDPVFRLQSSDIAQFQSKADRISAMLFKLIKKLEHKKTATQI